MATIRLLCVGMLLFACSAAAQSPVTNSTVVELSKAGLSDNAVIAVITKGPRDFDLSPNALISFRQAGVSNAVIEAMLAGNTDQPKPSAAPVSNTQNLPAAYGIYAFDSGQYHELGPATLKSRPGYTKNVQFLVYGRNASELNVVSLVFVRNKISYTDDFSNPRGKVTAVNDWDMVFSNGDTSKIIDYRVHPIQANSRAIMLVPRAPLSTGAYAVIQGSLESSGPLPMPKTVLAVFYVQRQAAETAVKTGEACFDVQHGSGQGGWANWRALNNGQMTLVRCRNSGSTDSAAGTITASGKLSDVGAKPQRSQQALVSPPKSPERVGAEAAFSSGQAAASSKDYVQAMQWWRKAADQGYAGAQNNVGVLFNKGWGVPQDYGQAMQWYRKAADQGYAAAQYNIGVLFLNGQGVLRDAAQAKMWMQKAASSGSPDAQTWLATQK
jgi:hypothetical protein